MSLLLTALIWTRPWGLGLLLLPLALLLLSRRRSQPTERATGTLELWRQVSEGAARPRSGSKRRVPPRVWLLAAALVAGALAIAGPAGETRPRKPLWELEVDRSPSMFLPLELRGSRTRYDLALEMVLEELEAREVPASARRWSSAGLVAVAGERPPEDWSQAPRTFVGELDALTSSGRVRVSDHWPSQLDLPLGGVASGGPAVPGPVAESGGRQILWDGRELVEGEQAPVRGVWIEAGVPRVLREFVEVWARERSLVAVAEASAAELRLRRGAAGQSRAVRVAQGSWSLVGTARGAPTSILGRPLLEAEDGSALLWSSGSGELLTSLVEIEVLEGDPAAVALAWGRLLDEALPPPAGVVPFAERQAAGAARRVELQAPEVARGVEAGAVPPAAYLALAALLLALAALAPGWRSPARASGRRPLSDIRKLQ